MKSLVTKVIALAIAASWLGCQPRDVQGPERQVVSRIREATDFFAQTHTNTFPDEWEDVGKLIDLGKLNYLSTKWGMGTVQSAYLIVTNNLRLFGPARILFLRSKPVREDGKVGRYMIQSLEDGRVVVDWIRETDLQRALAAKGMVLPAPVGGGEVTGRITDSIDKKELRRWILEQEALARSKSGKVSPHEQCISLAAWGALVIGTGAILIACVYFWRRKI